MINTNSLLFRIVTVGVISLILTLSALLSLPAAAQSGGARDCDDNAVLRCGAYSLGELRQKYNSQAGAKTIFSHFGISSSEVNNMPGRTVNGHVTRDGKVVVDGKTVATNAVTVGRHNMAGSKQVTKNGTTFYTRPPSASFGQSKLDAYVVMNNKQFSYAVIKSCGNPLTATPKTPQAPPQTPPTPPPAPPTPPPAPPQTPPTPPPAPPTPPPAPPTQVQIQQQQQNVIVENPVTVVQKQEAPAPAPAPAPQPQPTVLPDTGPGHIAGVSSAVSLASMFGYSFYRWLRVKFGLF